MESGFGPLPTWVLIVIFGREIFITAFRSYAVNKGLVIPAGVAGKRKALLQMLFIGGLLLWYPLLETATANAWSGSLWEATAVVVRAFVAITLAAAIVMTVYSLLDYLWSYRTLVGIRD